MKEQRLITSDDRIEWELEVDRHFKKGWRVVPGTVSTSITSSYEAHYTKVYKIFAIVLERE
jgi:hypothetical protein